MAVNDIYQVRLSGSYLAKDFNNVFHYQQTADSGQSTLQPSEDLALAFLTAIITPLVAVTDESCVYNELFVVNYRFPQDFNTQDIGTNGTVQSDGLPAFVAWSFRTPQFAPGVRRGRKRFTGVPENLTTNDQPTPSALVLLQVLANQMSATLVRDGRSFLPVIARGNKVLGVNPAFFPAGNWGIAPTGLATQNTRKT